MKKEKKTNWQKQLKQEFAIHFKNSPDEFQFLEAFIEDLLKETIQRFIEEVFPKEIGTPTSCCGIYAAEQRKELKRKAKQWLKENLYPKTDQN